MKPQSCVRPSRIEFDKSFSANEGWLRLSGCKLIRLTAPALVVLCMGVTQLKLHAQQYGPPDQYAPPPQYSQQPQYEQPPPYQQPQYPQQQQYQQPQYSEPPQYAQGQPPAGPDYGPGPGVPGPGDQAYGQPQQPAAQPFAAQQLEQLVAPIALYPDNAGGADSGGGDLSCAGGGGG